MTDSYLYNLAQPHFDQSALATYSDQPKPVIVEGIVVAESDTRDAYTNLRVEADTLVITDRPTRTMKGLVLVQAPPGDPSSPRIACASSGKPVNGSSHLQNHN